MWGFWRRFVARLRELGGELRVGCAVDAVTGSDGRFELHTRRGSFEAAQVVCALPAPLAARVSPAPVGDALRPFLERNAKAAGGAIVLFPGVPEDDVDAPLGDGNNMFVAVSTPGALESAPAGHRAVMVSTHCALEPWEGLSADEYEARKRAIGERS